MTIFEQIINNKLPAEKVFENARILVIKDIHPAAPIHLLIISKKKIKDLQSVEEKDLPLIGEMIQVAQKMAEEFGITEGYRLVVNNGERAGQTIFHLHFHLLGGRSMEALL